MPPEPDRYAGGEMSLIEHLRELRSRLIKSVLAITGAFVVGFLVRDYVLEIVTAPYCALPNSLRAAGGTLNPEESCTLVFLDVLGAFKLSLKAAAMVAVVLATPIVCYQIWRFVTPGLRPVERRYAIPFIAISQLLFAAGAVFSYFIIPRALEFLLGFAGDRVESLMDANQYLTFIIRTMLAFGLAFELPLLLIILSLMGVVTSDGLRRYRRHAWFGTFAAAAFITPTQDPFTMCVMALPLILFYEVSVVAARMIERRRALETATAGTAGREAST